MTGMQNNVADWLPDDYPETVDLKEFRKYFVGDQFVMVTGPWCREGDPNYVALLRKLRSESVENDEVLKEMGLEEELRAHRKGNELGLLPPNGRNYHQDWGQHNEKWLQGANEQWYWINRQGELYRWEGQNNVVEGVKRSGERMVNGHNEAVGTYIATFGEPPDDENDIPNLFYAFPEKLCARPFKSITTGPEILEMMAGPGGTIRIGRVNEEDDPDDLSAFEARMEAHKRLTGSLFGPTPPVTFSWTFESLLQSVSEDRSRATWQNDRPSEIEVQVFELRRHGGMWLTHWSVSVYDGRSELLLPPLPEDIRTDFEDLLTELELATVTAFDYVPPVSFDALQHAPLGAITNDLPRNLCTRVTRISG